MENKDNTLQAKLEALLFIYGEPMNFTKIAQTLEVAEEEAKNIAGKLGEHLVGTGSGLMLITKEDEVQLVTRPDFSKLLDKVLKTELNESLTPAGLETLSIITYSSPISRAEIDYIRGVNSSYTLRALSLRGLIERANDASKGNAYVYRPSFEMLKYIGISKLEDLPEYERFRTLVESIKNPVKQTEEGTQKQEA